MKIDKTDRALILVLALIGAIMWWPDADAVEVPHVHHLPWAPGGMNIGGTWER